MHRFLSFQINSTRLQILSGVFISEYVHILLNVFRTKFWMPQLLPIQNNISILLTWSLNRPSCLLLLRKLNQIIKVVHVFFCWIYYSVFLFFFFFSDWVIGCITNRLLGCMLAVIKHKCGGFFCTVLSVKGVYLTFSMCYLVWQTQLPHMNDSIYLTKTVLLHFYHVHACFLSHLSSTL